MPAIAIGLLVALNLAAWGSSLANEFVFDDLQNILGNPWVRDWRLLPQAFVHHAAGFDANFSTSFYRPLMHVLYGLTHALAGARPWAFHLLNLLLHVVTVIAVYAVGREALARWGDTERHPHAPLFAAIVFSVHPVHSEPIQWVAGITDLSCTALGLAAWLAYVRARKRAAFSWIAAVLLLMSLLAKETGAVFLLLLALVEWLDGPRTATGRWRAAVLRIAPSIGALILYLALRVAALGSFAPLAAQHARGPTEILVSALGLFGRYVGLLVAPVQLTVMRPIALESGFGDPWAWGGLTIAAAMAVLAWRHRRSATVVLSAAFTVLPILPALYTPAIESGGSVFGERYLYLPVLGLGLLVGVALEEARRRFAAGRVVVLAFVMVFVTSGITAANVRNRAWANSLALWTDAVAKAPGSAAAQEGLCFALYRAGRFPESLDACARALDIEPSRVDARLNHATALLAMGRAGDAIRGFDAVLAARPNLSLAWVNRGLACMVLGRRDEAMSSYRRALEANPADAEAHNVFGVALAQSGRPDLALPHLEQAVSLAPENPEYRENLRVLRGGPARD